MYQRDPHPGTSNWFTILRAPWLLAVATVTTLLLTACGSESKMATDSSLGDSSVEDILASLSLEQKVAQMIQAEIAHVTPADVRQYGLGSILNGGGSFPNANKHSSREDWVALADAFYEASVDTSEGNAGIPIIWGTDAVHGHNNVIGATLFPHNIGLGAARNPELIAEIAAATAREVRATGIDWIFAPTVAVATDFRWGRTYESYSADSALVADYADGFVSAMQGEGVVATAKHFIGDGGTHLGQDQGNVVMPLEQLLAEHGAGYYSALEADVMTVMASFNSWNGNKVHGSKTLLTDVLKDRMGFEGFVVSDWNGIGQVKGCKPDDCAQAINAGIDMVMVTKDWLSLMNRMIAQVQSGIIPEARIDDAVRRILRVKQRIGLLDGQPPSAKAAAVADTIGSPAHRATARQAVRESLVLLKNAGGLVPLSPKGTYLVLGSAADDIGQQSGGWTISWQGTGNTNDDFPGATSILDGIREQVSAAGGVVYTLDTLPEATVPDAVIAVYGETPYAEGQGDVDSLDWKRPVRSDLSQLSQYRELGSAVVSIFVSGRPMWVNAELNASDAFVAAWLPGSEGAGVADVLFRTEAEMIRHDFTGRLPMPWPATDVAAGDQELAVAEHLFPLGYGLAGGETGTLAQLDETPLGVVESLDEPIFVGGLKDPWGLFIGDDAKWNVSVGPRGAVTKRGELAVSVVDRHVQEDARRVTWTGDGANASQIYFQYDVPVNVDRLRLRGGALSFELRLRTPPTHAVELRMDCDWPCSGALDFGSLLETLESDQWLTVAVPLSCFVEAGTQTERVDTPFLLSTTGALEIDLAEVVLAESVESDVRASCPGSAFSWETTTD